MTKVAPAERKSTVSSQRKPKRVFSFKIGRDQLTHFQNFLEGCEQVMDHFDPEHDDIMVTIDETSIEMSCNLTSTMKLVAKFDRAR